jgi:hypothetical protein
MPLVFVCVIVVLPVLNIAGAIACIWYRRLSRWLALVMIGMFGQSITWLCPIMSAAMVRRGELGSDLGGMIIGFSVWAVLMTALIVSGLIMTCGDLQQRLRKLRERLSDVQDRQPLVEAREHWRSRQGDSHDIQQ